MEYVHYPDGPADYEFKKEQEVNLLGLGVQQQHQQGGYIIHLTHNASRLMRKKEIVEYNHAAVGCSLIFLFTCCICLLCLSI